MLVPAQEPLDRQRQREAGVGVGVGPERHHQGERRDGQRAAAAGGRIAQHHHRRDRGRRQLAPDPRPAGPLPGHHREEAAAPEGLHRDEVPRQRPALRRRQPAGELTERGRDGGPAGVRGPLRDVREHAHRQGQPVRGLVLGPAAGGRLEQDGRPRWRVERHLGAHQRLSTKERQPSLTR